MTSQTNLIIPQTDIQALCLYPANLFYQLAEMFQSRNENN